MPDFFQIFDANAIGGYSPIVVFFAFFFATFISEDLACLTAGALAANGKISFALALLACFAGIFVGDILLYWTGRIFGKNIVETKLFSRFVSDKSIEKASLWLNKNGASAIFLSRFITGLRLPTYLAAGFLRTDFLKFTFYFLLATAIWTPILVGSTAFAGQFFFSKNLFLAVILSFVLLKITLHFASWKNRRFFVGRLKRLTNWEFWSLKIFYFPVVVYVLFLAIKHRSLTIFTCANPAILASGFIGESKAEIYEGLKKYEANASYLLNYTKLCAENSFTENLNKARIFIDENDLQFPLALKPDAGERGKEVKILRHFEELETSIFKLEADFILQEFFDGVETSVFYFRYPNRKKGEIFSITEKTFPHVTGDGKSNLETLILRDKRAVCLAKKYLGQNAERLDFVPESGAKVKIINIGTHSRGAIFSDGEHLKTIELEEKIDEICRGFEGFYFGRFDIRARSFEDFSRAENFKIIELNGVTSESTNIYDKKFSLFAAYNILFRQWKIAFEIGAENFRRGAKATTVSDLIKLIFGKKIQTDFTTNNEQLTTNN
ncbi:MAG TPA: DedA family protein [Pyrinomonadaceae bacterium]|nr:DedA family protein [Pyrinomonadaceae bacterium]